jgi:hypothetical protein
MQTHNVSTVLAGILVLSLSLPAATAEKTSGVNKEYQMLSETSTTVPDKPDHVVKQFTSLHKTVCQGGVGSCALGESWASEVAQQDIIGTDSTIRGYGTNHYQNGDLGYYSFEGAAKTTMKGGGDFETAAQGKYTELGGTGKFKTVKGSGTYTCKFTPKSGQCDWQGDEEM